MSEPFQLMDAKELLFQLATSLVLGLLVGLQRERSREYFGIRTFPLITIFGTLSAFLTTQFGFWILPAGYLCLTLTGVAAFVFPAVLNKMNGNSRDRFYPERRNSDDLFKNPNAVSNKDDFSSKDGSNKGEIESDEVASGNAKLFPDRRNEFDFGTTTLITSLVMYSVGAMLANPKWTLLALEVGGVTAILLQLKTQLHQIAARLGENDMKAIMQFVMISFIILPILPDKNFGPFDSFNPFETWLMVVLIVGMSLGGYIVYKFWGENAGVLLSGFLGGAISSTATTVCYAKMTRAKTTTPRIAAVVILISSAVLLIRVLIVMAIISPDFFFRSLVPVSIFMIASFVPAAILWRSVKNDRFETPEQSNPTQWKSALTFGVIYAVVLFAMNAIKAEIGTSGLYWVSGVSGLVDMNAVVLSTSRLALDGSEIVENGWRYIIVGSAANLVFKWATVFALAGRSLAVLLFSLFLIPLAAAVLLLALF